MQNSERKFGLIPVEVWHNETSLEIFKKMAAGVYPAPPIGKTFDFGVTEVESGRIVFEGEPTANFYNPLGVIHGGFITTLLDSAMACAIQSVLEKGKAATSIELKVNFVRPAKANTGTLRAIGEIIHVGRQIATAEGKLFDAAGKLYAHATTSCFIFDL